MLKKFNPILEKIPVVFCDDVYLADKNGDVLSYRQGRERNIKNIFHLLGERELDFVRKNYLLSNFYPFLLVKSSEGLMLLDFALFITNRVFVAIIPHLSEDKILSICKSRFSMQIFPSPSLKESFDTAEIIEFDDEQTGFGQNFELICRANRLYRTRGLTNVELADLMLDVAHDICDYIGSEIDFEVEGLALFELKNEFCFDSFKFMLITLCLSIRKYSSDRRGSAVIHFDEMGISLSVSFDIAEDYSDLEFLTSALELAYLKKFSYKDGFSCHFDIMDNTFSALGYLWKAPGDFEHIKKDIAEFKYTNE